MTLIDFKHDSLPTNVVEEIVQKISVSDKRIAISIFDENDENQDKELNQNGRIFKHS